jgi:hypothetical protein
MELDVFKYVVEFLLINLIDLECTLDWSSFTVKNKFLRRRARACELPTCEQK